MARHVGRKIRIKRGGEPIASVRSKTIPISNEAIDVTTDDDDGFQTFLEDSAKRGINLSVEGVMEDEDLVEQAVTTGSLIGATEIELLSGATITGNFRLNSYTVTGEHDGATTFSAELVSTGPYQWNAA